MGLFHKRIFHIKVIPHSKDPSSFVMRLRRSTIVIYFLHDLNIKKERTITDDNKIIDKYKLNEKNLNCLQTNLDTNNNKKIKAINRKENKVNRQYNFIKLKRHRLTTTF